jgi:hypothetical protein
MLRGRNHDAVRRVTLVTKPWIITVTREDPNAEFGDLVVPIGTLPVAGAGALLTARPPSLIAIEGFRVPATAVGFESAIRHRISPPIRARPPNNFYPGR